MRSIALSLTLFLNIILFFHTKEGGKQPLKNGEKLDFDMKPKSNLLLNADTGEVILN